jgi:hypothetical protein
MKSTSIRLAYLLLLGACIFATTTLQAQTNPTLSIQGILKKSNGVAVDDGTYSLTFKLYTQETGGSIVWQETQAGVEVNSGIYNAVLGAVNPLTAAFDQLYYLGVTVGSSELTPRVLLTSAPYALSLIGVNNKFPSSGAITADSARIATNLVVGGNLPTTHSVVAVGGYLARGGAPGLNGANNNGYAFDGNSGDKDSGLFSTADGKVSLYANNAEVLAATPGNVAVTGSVNANNVGINNNGSLSYNGLNDWRLVETDYFEGGANEGWSVSAPTSGTNGAWNNGTVSAASAVNYGDFAGWVLKPATNDHVFKKQFAPPGSYTYVKVVFKFFAIGNWDFEDAASVGFGALATNGSGGGIRVAWDWHPRHHSNTHNYNNDAFRTASSFDNMPDNVSDQWTTGTMIARRTSPFWVYFGYSNDEGEDNEQFAIGGIEIWVK